MIRRFLLVLTVLVFLFNLQAAGGEEAFAFSSIHASVRLPQDAYQTVLTPDNLQKAWDVMSKYGHRILLPTDVAVERDGKRQNVLAGDMPNDVPALDIGDDSIAKFIKVIQSSKTSLMSGPAGMYEKDGFDTGTKALMEAMIDSGGQSVIGGGHTVGAADKLDLTDRFSYVSTGGGALETFLLGKELPVVEALKYSFNNVKV